MLEHSISRQRQALTDGEYSPVELVRAYLENIERQSQLNCYISVFAEQALDAAAKCDVGSGPLAGIPIAHKDIFCQRGTRSTAGSRMLDNFVSPYDATVVSRLDAAGVITLGKTNMDEFAMGSSTEHSYYGPTRNPWNPDYVPGGSSGGSAAAVAARLCSAATGTDTGGSIRQPAAFCGITGLKPTYGRVSRWGMIAFGSSLDAAGPMARDALDCALLLSAMAGFDSFDSTSASEPVPDYAAELDKPIKGLKVGVSAEFETGLPTQVKAALDRVASELEHQGATLTRVSLPNAHLAIPCYYIVAPAECSANLARYDGVRFGHRCENPRDLEDLYKRSRSEGFGKEVRNRVMAGTFALSAAHYEEYYRKAQQVRRLIRDDFIQAFQDVDLILSPTTLQTAFRLGEKTADAEALYREDTFTAPVNLAGLPAISIPAGQVDGMPIGTQLIGPHFGEVSLLQTAHQIQVNTDWHLASPESAQERAQ